MKVAVTRATVALATKPILATKQVISRLLLSGSFVPATNRSWN